MARSIQQKTRTVAPGGDYTSFGRIKDDTGSNDGTPVDVEVYNDFHEFFDYLMQLAGVTPNGLADNDTNGFQLVESLFKFAQRQQAPSSFSDTYGTGSKNITLTGDYSGNYAFKVGQNVRYTNADDTSYLQGVVTGYTGSTLTVDVYDFNDDSPSTNLGTVYLAQQQITGKKIIEIGTWDMDSDAFVAVNHGVDNTKIRSVNVIIRNDANTITYDLNRLDGSVDTSVAGAVQAITSAQVLLRRTNGGSFDTSNYSTTGYNRGWITIEYEI